jgi:voltage-gated potassium channel Kch
MSNSLPQSPTDVVIATPHDDPEAVTRVTYRIFILSVTLFSFVVVALFYLLPLPQTVREVLYFLDFVMAFILLFDFGARLVGAPHKLRYLFPLGLLDLAGSIPGVPYLRLLRIPSFIIGLRDLRTATPTEVRNVARQKLAESTLLSGIFLALLVAAIGGILIVLVESPVQGSNIKTGGDAIWYALVTISTVGYGDRFPVTLQGRIIGAAMILVGVGIFSVLTGYISTQFLARRKGAGPTEVDLLRQRIEALFEQQRQLAAADRATLEAQLAELRTQLKKLSRSHAPRAVPARHVRFRHA